MITLTPEQHRLFTSAVIAEIGYRFERRDLECARLDGKVSRLDLAKIRHTAHIDAVRAGQCVVDTVLALSADSQPAKHSLADLLALAR